MAFCFGRQFRRIAAEALTADRDEMRALVERLLPPRDDGAPPVLCLERETDRQRAPAVIVAAFFADAVTGDEAADLLRQTEDPAFRKQPLQDQVDNTYGLYGPIALDPEWRRRAGLPPRAPRPEMDYPPWGPPVSHNTGRDATDTARCSAVNEAGGLVNNKENTSEPCCDAAVTAPERPP